MTVLMHSWYYEKKDLKRTPSIVGGLDVERESRYRREGARFIINVGTKMGLRYDTMATGVVYFHRFYMFHSFQTFPRYVTACCCLFLAGKVEETPKKCKDIIRTAKTFLAESQFAQFGDDPKEEVMTLERILLQTIKFDLQVDHPYSHLLKYAKSLKGDKGKLHNMVQMAWTFINDSLCTTLCLQWEPEVIAIALMYLAGKLSKFEVLDWTGRLPKHNHWWDMFIEGMSVELLEDVCHQVLDLYSMPVPDTPRDSPPATPPTKSTRKTSQPPSPVETSTSPAQIKPTPVKPKEPPVGQPIPRLEPGELKRKVSQTDKEHIPEGSKIPRITEGKAIPTITRHSPKAIPTTSREPDPEPSPPSSPVPERETMKTLQDTSQPSSSSDPIFKSGLTSSFLQNPPFSHGETSASKIAQHITQVAATSFSVPPPTATYTQTAPPFYPDSQSFPNMQQPPPLFSQRPPVQYQHPPPPPPPSGPPPPGLHPPPPPHSYPPGLPPSGVPPFNSQFPPPRHQPPLLANPPSNPPLPGMVPPPPSHSQGMPPVPSLIRGVPPPPPPGVHPIRHMGPEGIYGAAPDMYADERNRNHKDRMSQDFLPRQRFDGSFHGRRDSDFDPPFPRGMSYRRPPPPPPNAFNQGFERPRRFPMDNQQQRKHPGAQNPSTAGNSQQQGGPTGIPPVRITGSQ